MVAFVSVQVLSLLASTWVEGGARPPVSLPAHLCHPVHGPRGKKSNACASPNDRDVILPCSVW